MSHGRRAFVVLLFLGFLSCATTPQPVAAPPPALDPFFERLHQQTFDFFWDLGRPDNGLVPDRWPSPSFSSIAAVGFGLTAYPIGVEHGYISRDQAIARTLATLRFFAQAPQGPAARGTIGYQGFFYHFLDMKTGERFESVELSTVDTALLLAGVLFAQSYFDQPGGDEAEIRRLAEEIYTRVDWRWAQLRPPAISHGWKPEIGVLQSDWRGYNEAMLVYLLALGSPAHAVGAEAWEEWTSPYDRTWGTFYGQEHLSFAPLFGHHYTHAWVDFRGIRDRFMAGRGLDYFENSRRAAYAQRAYAIANPLGWEGYGENVWGLTACDGPVDATLPYKGEPRLFRTYSARGVGLDEQLDDGTLAPTAVVASLPFAPEIVIPAVLEMKQRYGQHILGRYGFWDSFNPSFRYDVPVQHGKVIPGFGWVDGDYLGIDQGPILLMLENYQTGLVWETMKKNPHLVRGLRRAGFEGGWLNTGAANDP